MPQRGEDRLEDVRYVRPCRSLRLGGGRGSGEDGRLRPRLPGRLHQPLSFRSTGARSRTAPALAAGQVQRELCGHQDRRGSGPVVELIRIEDRKIQEIEAIFLPQLLPYGFGTGWD